jgi:hypothetical protein
MMTRFPLLKIVPEVIVQEVGYKKIATRLFDAILSSAFLSDNDAAAIHCLESAFMIRLLRYVRGDKGTTVTKATSDKGNY